MPYRLTPGDLVEFAQLPLGAVCKFVHLRDDTLWIKVSARKVLALLSKEAAAKCPEIGMDGIPKKLVVQRYWIGDEVTPQAPDRIIAINLSEMTPLEVERPSNGQKCTVALFDERAKELLDYRKSIVWDAHEQDWFSDPSDEHYFCESEYVSAIEFAREFSYCFFWKPAPAP